MPERSEPAAKQGQAAIFLAGLAVLLGTLTASSQPPPAAAGQAPSDAAIEDAAKELLPNYSDPDRDTSLRNLYLLQLAASRYAEADATIGTLMDFRRRDFPERVARLYSWRTFARAKRLAAENGGDDRAAIDAAFAQTIGNLPDKEVVNVYPYLQVSMESARHDLQTALAGCAGQKLATCNSRFDVILNFAFVRMWSYLLPRVAALADADVARRFRIDRHVMIATPDGAKLEAMVVRPRAATRPLTALLEFTIYADDDTSLARASKMAAYGYAGVEAYSRGKGRSPGQPMPYEYDGRDAATVIDWMARQGWSDRRVGMFSSSYNGFTQWAAAKHRPKALKAIAASASAAPGIDIPMEHNIFQTFVYSWPFYVTDNKYLDDAVSGDSARWNRLNRQYYLSGRPYRELEKIDGTPNPLFAKWLRHPSYDSYWRSMIPYGDEFAKIDIPVLATTGYFDGAQPAVLYYFRQHVKHRPGADDRLLVGPFVHTQMQLGIVRGIGGYDYDPVAVMDLQDVRLQWFDHVFHGAPLPALLSGRVNFEVMGANLWRHVDSLGAMGTGRLRLHLGPAEVGGRFALTRTAPAGTGAAHLQVDLADRRDVDYQPPFGATNAQIDTRNALVFETEPFDKPIEIDGPFSGRIAVTTNKKDFDLSVALYEQMKDGHYFRLAYFIGRASYIPDRSRRQLLVPGRERLLAFESERMSARRIGAGSRIVAVVGIVKRPNAQINYGTGRDVSSESIADAGKPLTIAFSNRSVLDLQVRD